MSVVLCYRVFSEKDRQECLSYFVLRVFSVLDRQECLSYFVLRVISVLDRQECLSYFVVELFQKRTDRNVCPTLF